MVFLYNFQLAWSGIPYISLASFRILSFCISYVTFVLNVERILNIRLGIGNFTLGNCPTCRPGAGSGTLHSGLWVWISPFRTLPSTASTEPVENYLQNWWALSVSTGYKTTCSVWRSNIPECQLAGVRWPPPLCLMFSHPKSLQSSSCKEIL